MLSANALILDQSIYLSYGKGLIWTSLHFCPVGKELNPLLPSDVQIGLL